MPSTQARTTREVLCRFALCDPAIVAESITHTGFGSASSNGAADGTTLIDVNGSALSSVAHTYNDSYAVRMLSGTYKGEMKRIVGDDGAGTLTLEGNGFTGQIDSGDEYEIVKLPDAGLAVSTGVPTTTEFVDATRTEADDEWIGYYAIPISGALRGEVQRITDFANATGTFTTEAFSAAPAVGDVILLRKYIEIGSPAGGFDQSVLPRRSKRVNFSMGKGVVGPKGAGPLTFETDVFGNTAHAAADVVALPNVLGDLFEMCGLVRSADSAASVDAGSSTTDIKIATGKHENFTIGNFVMYAGHMRVITGKTDGGAGVDTITVSPALPTAPVSGQVLYACRNYRKTTTADVKFGIIEIETDGIRHTYLNCRGTFDWTDDAPNTIAWSFTYEHYMREDEAAPENPQSATTQGYLDIPFLASHDKQVWLDAVAADIGGFTTTPGIEVTPRPVSGRYGINGRAGAQVTDVVCGATYRELLYSDGNLDRELDFQQQIDRDFIAVWGSHVRAVALRMPAFRITGAPHPEDTDGLQDTPIVVEAADAGTANDPADGIVLVPDYVIAIAG